MDKTLDLTSFTYKSKAIRFRNEKVFTLGYYRNNSFIKELIVKDTHIANGHKPLVIKDELYFLKDNDLYEFKSLCEPLKKNVDDIRNIDDRLAFHRPAEIIRHKPMVYDHHQELLFPGQYLYLDKTSANPWFIKEEILLSENHSEIDNPKIYFRIRNRYPTPFEECLALILANNGYPVSYKPGKAKILMAYGDDVLDVLSKPNEYVQAVSLSTYINKALTLGLDHQDMQTVNLHDLYIDKLKKSRLNRIDNIKIPVFIIHGEKEKEHPLEQALFFYTSLRDRCQNRNAICIVPNMNESLYNICEPQTINKLATEILKFLNYETASR